MSLILQLTNQQNWYKLYDEHREARLLAPRGHIPIPAFEIPILLENRVLACRVLCPDAKSRWRFGGNLSQRWQLGSGGGQSALPVADGSTFYLRVNRSKLLIVPQYGNYQLLYEPPTWFKNVQFTLWQYTGLVEDSTEKKVDLARERLFDIESKIDTILNS